MTQIGEKITHWHMPPVPKNLTLIGKYASLYPISAKYHAKALFSAFKADKENKIWTYLPYGPFKTYVQFQKWIEELQEKNDPYFFAIKKNNQNILCGMASYLRIKPHDGSIEVGHINFAPQLQNTIPATEAMYLMMKWVFENGYRRYEWKCNALNRKSRNAAQRFGFSYEGVFRQATISKGRNRDTAWFAIIDKEWKEIQKCYMHISIQIILMPRKSKKKP